MLSSRLSPPPSRSVRFSQLPSPLPLDRITEGSEYHCSNGEQSEVLGQSSQTSSAGWSSPHRTSRPRASILKHRNSFEEGDRNDEQENYNFFEVSVRPHRTSCCNTLVRVEHISDWLHDKPSDGLCPTCNRACSLELSTYPPNALTPNRESAAVKTPLSLEQLMPLIESLSLLFSALFLNSSSSSSSTPLARRYSVGGSNLFNLFNAGDDVYPSSEHSMALGSSPVSNNMSEVFTRVTSIAGLTLVLFTLLS